MKNQKVTWSIIGIVVVVVIIIVAVMHGSGNQTYGNNSGGNSTASGSNTPAPVVSTAPVGQVATVSASTKSYQNPELGFSVNYPTTWGLSDSDNGPTFTIPNSGNTGIVTLQSQIYFVPGACAFPPIATSTITGRSTMVAGSLSYKMIKVSVTAHSQSNLDEMYTLQQGTTQAPGCYVFSFASTATTPVSAASQTVINNAATAFTAMVRSFAVVVGPAGQSETAHPNGQ